MCWRKLVTPIDKVATCVLVQGSRMWKHPFSYSGDSQTCLCTSTCMRSKQAEYTEYTLSICRISWSLGAVAERLGFLCPSRKNSLDDPNHPKSQIWPCWNSEFGLNFPPKPNVCPPIALPYICWLLFICFSSKLCSVVLKWRKNKESNPMTLGGISGKCQVLQRSQSETNFADLGLPCIMAARWAVGMFLCSKKVSVSLSGKMKFFGEKLFLSGRTTHSSRRWSTR